MNTVTCAKCQATLLGVNFNTGALSPCPACGTPLRVEVFPALFRKIERGGAGEALVEGGEASCFYHPQKRAAVACESCGRFLCELCDLHLDNRHLCPNCLASGQKKGRLRNLERERVLYDNIAVSLAVLPLLMWPFTLVTAPGALYVAIRYWNAPTSILPRRTKLKFVIAILLALAQIVGWIVLIYYGIFQRR